MKRAITIQWDREDYFSLQRVSTTTVLGIVEVHNDTTTVLGIVEVHIVEVHNESSQSRDITHGMSSTSL